jgi:REase_MTES_1575/AAA domain
VGVRCYATFQGNERDIVFLSMVADPAIKQAQTALHFEQRFNVAMSRARDRMYLVRSVREEELKPDDLKAKVLRHFRDPMKGSKRPEGDAAALCDSDFERAVLRRLLERGYRVTPQVGALGYKIDLVVEGTGDRRLAVECDGDQYHGPDAGPTTWRGSACSNGWAGGSGGAGRRASPSIPMAAWPIFSTCSMRTAYSRWRRTAVPSATLSSASPKQDRRTAWVGQMHPNRLRAKANPARKKPDARRILRHL